MAEELARLLDEHDYENAGTTMIEGRAAFIQREIMYTDSKISKRESCSYDSSTNLTHHARPSRYSWHNFRIICFEYLIF